jgi:carbonic anhydrase/acetyltransferase-like protein (isoleucine patch superfamily)
MPEPLIIAVSARTPQIHAEAWVTPNASVIDQVTLAAPAGVWVARATRRGRPIATTRAAMNACSSGTA